MKKKKLSKGQMALHILFIIMSCTYVLPLIMVISISFTDETSLIRDGFGLIPKVFSTRAYEMAFGNPAKVIRAYIVTIIFSLAHTALSVLIMGVMAYPLARPKYRFNRIVSLYVLFTMLFSAGLVPTYILNVKYLHLNNTIWIYILPGLVEAYNLFIIRTNYKSLPGELFEAAKIDGAGELYICFKIVFPLCKPVLASIGFLTLVGKWNDWHTALYYIKDPDLYSLQYLLQRILQSAEALKKMADMGMMLPGEEFPSESLQYAMAVIAAGPMLVVFPFFQKYFAKGMTLGSVKG